MKQILQNLKIGEIELVDIPIPSPSLQVMTRNHQYGCVTLSVSASYK